MNIQKGVQVETFNGLCGIKNCDLPELAAGFCNKHWRRLRKFGSPFWLAKPAASYRGLAAEQRFFPRVSKSAECWNWTGGTDRDGYGLFMGKVGEIIYRKAHRWSWAYHNKAEIPRDMGVCHKCDNRLCVNPAHLFLGTVQENQYDKKRKGRSNVAFGSHHYETRLSDVDVEAILASHEPQRVLAERYGLTQSTISAMKIGRSWKHIPRSGD